LKLPFRDAHHVTGRVVALAEGRGLELEALTLADLRSIEPRFRADALDVLSVENSVRSRTSYGGTAPQSVRKMAKSWVRKLEKAAGAG
jgi:argininosuccinate lyase